MTRLFAPLFVLLARCTRNELARPGENGSLYRRFVNDDQLTASLYAKTGTINHVSALSGYLIYPDADGGNTPKVLAFSILANGHGLGQARNISAVAIRALQNELVKIMDKAIVSELAQ